MADAAKPRPRVLRWLIVFGGLIVAAAGLSKFSSSAEQARGRHTTSPSAGALHAGHEVTDINVRGTVMILATMAATTALVVGIVFVMIWRFHVHQRPILARLTPIETEHVVTPPPRLEVNPLAALARQLARQHRLLNHYAWADASHDVARIPIARAMALTVGKSLDAHP